MSCVPPAEGTSDRILPKAHQANPELVSLKQHMCSELGLQYEHDFMLQYKAGVYCSSAAGLSVNQLYFPYIIARHKDLTVG